MMPRKEVKTDFALARAASMVSKDSAAVQIVGERISLRSLISPEELSSPDPSSDFSGFSSSSKYGLGSAWHEFSTGLKRPKEA